MNIKFPETEFGPEFIESKASRIRRVFCAMEGKWYDKDQFRVYRQYVKKALQSELNIDPAYVEVEFNKITHNYHINITDVESSKRLMEVFSNEY